MKILYLIATTPLFLASCAGGAGGGTYRGSNFIQFTTLSAIAPGTTVRANGLSSETTYIASGASVTSVSPPSTPTTNTAVDISFDSAGLLNKLVITTPLSSTTLDKAVGAVFGTLIGSSGEVGVAVSQDGSKFAVYPYSPTTLGWDYQTFGVWETGRGTGNGTAGAVSVGSATLATNLPTSGTATFTGVAGGTYIDASGADYLTKSLVSLTTDFSARSIGFSTTSTVKALTSNLTTGTSDSNLNMSGTLTWTAGINAFSGSVSTVGRTLSGNATGRFYGPSATEAGGVFYLVPTSGVESYGGAFGAKR